MPDNQYSNPENPNHPYSFPQDPNSEYSQPEYQYSNPENPNHPYSFPQDPYSQPEYQYSNPENPNHPYSFPQDPDSQYSQPEYQYSHPENPYQSYSFPQDPNSQSYSYPENLGGSGSHSDFPNHDSLPDMNTFPLRSTVRQAIMDNRHLALDNNSLMMKIWETLQVTFNPFSLTPFNPSIGDLTFALFLWNHGYSQHIAGAQFLYYSNSPCNIGDEPSFSCKMTGGSISMQFGVRELLGGIETGRSSNKQLVTAFWVVGSIHQSHERLQAVSDFKNHLSIELPSNELYLTTDDGDNPCNMEKRGENAEALACTYLGGPEQAHPRALLLLLAREEDDFSRTWVENDQAGIAIITERLEYYMDIDEDLRQIDLHYIVVPGF